MQLNPICSSHAVFAAAKPIFVFGKSEGEVHVTFLGRTQSAVPQNGNFCVEFPPESYGGPYEMTVEADGETRTLTDLWIGEVYLLSGQSNAQFKVGEGNTPAEEYVPNPNLRLFSVDLLDPDWQYFKSSMGWCVCDRVDEIGYWSALAFLTGRSVTARKGIHVGFVGCFQGASVIQSWLPKGEADEFGLRPEDKHPDHTDDFFGQWNGDGFLYDLMFRKLPPFAFTQVIWYQGESNTTPAEAKVYDRMVAKLFGIMRRDLRDPELPFLLVQIADYDDRRDEGWTGVQKAQERVPAICPGVTVVRSADVCESMPIHPPTKVKLAERIAALL